MNRAALFILFVWALIPRWKRKKKPPRMGMSVQEWNNRVAEGMIQFNKDYPNVMLKQDQRHVEIWHAMLKNRKATNHHE